ncbi:MAG: hypothetical protein NPIRA04_16990 [Nitrospirales bacterium]|nr:MAG: hypothetical protein NPIRA04_16990 [Nitrospirales bacterium]
MNNRKLDEFTVKGGGSIDPRKFKNEIFELFSIPAFDKGTPEIVDGASVGSAKKVIEPNDILLSKIVPHIRRCWVVPQAKAYRQIASGEWIQFRSAELVPEYVRHFLISDPFHSQFMKTVTGVGGSLLRARPSEVEKIKIPLPSPDDQIRIAHVLSKVEGLIAQRKHHLQQLDNLLKSVFLDMFGDPVRNEKGWNVDKFQRIILGLRNGLSPSKSGKNRSYVYTLSAITGEAFKEIYKEDTFSNVSGKYFPSKNDFLICRGNGNINLVGRAYFYPGNKGNIMFPDTIIGVTIESNAINKKFLESLWKTYFIRCQIEKEARTANGTYKINQGVINGINIILPPDELQNKFGKIVDKIESMKFHYQQSLTELENLYGALSQKAFKGELDLSRVPLLLELPKEDTESMEEMNGETHEKREMEEACVRFK